MIEENDSQESDTTDDSTTDESTTTDKIESQPFVSSSQSVSDQLDKQATGDPDEGDDAEDSSKDTDSTDTEKTETETEETSSSEGDKTTDSDDSDEESEQPVFKGAEKRKAEIQKEIDQLIATRNVLKDDLKATKTERSKDVEKKSDEETGRDFTNEELKAALKEFMDKGDETGVMDVMDYKLDKQRKDIVKLYQDDQKAAVDQVNAKNQEWQSIVKDYSPDSYDNPVLKDNSDFDVTDPKSVLYKLSKMYYEDAELGKNYKGSGGMRKAVQDAFNELLLKLVSPGKGGKLEKGKKDDKSTLNRLAKSERKRSLSSGSDDAGDKASAPSLENDVDVLADELKERKKVKDARTGVGV
jgi:hypothetical protein